MNNHLDMLNEKQKEAVLHNGSSLLILAGAGSGKTRVITTKIAYLIQEMGFNPGSILAVTFTNKAAREMRERVEQLTGNASGVMVRTFHSFGSWILRQNGHYLNIPSTYTIYDDDDSLSLLQNAFPGYSKKDLKPFSKMISKAKDYALSPDDDLGEFSYDPQFAEMYKTYQERLDRIGNVDFGDLILKPLQLLEQFEDVRTSLQNRFKVILVDEYQDSNAAQDRFLQSLAGPGSYVCVVGDDDQSIYRFRGAEVQNILTFPKRFSSCDVIRLEQNYRSTQPILDMASAVVGNNLNRLGKKLWTEKTEGKKPVFKRLPDQDAEAEYCADLLSDHNYEGTAVLYRTNAQSLAFESLFLRRGIPYQVVGSLRFYEREEVKDMLSYMAFLCNPRDEIAFKRIVNKPSRGVGAATRDMIVSEAELSDGNLHTACTGAGRRLKGKRAAGLQTFNNIIVTVKEVLETVPLPDFLTKLAEDSGLFDYYQEVDEESLSAKSDNLGQLISAAGEYPEGMDGLRMFLEDVELDRSRMADKDSTNRGVTLITMHNTKGLEFERVIITGLDEGLFPDSRGLADAASLEEERRIFYVSVTRAKSELYLLSARSRFIWGRRNYYDRSRFIDEIPGEFYSVDGQGGGAEEDDGYKPGTWVYHDDYGNGQVIKNWYNGKEQLIIVQFESGQQSTFLPKYTPLEKISPDE